jgi:probable phosphoglycerate mutase
MAKWLKKYDTGGPIGPKAAPIKINGTEVFEHGEDTATANKQENGINPTNLTEKGVKYAKSVGQEALKRGKKAILTSNVQRAKETADVIGQTAGLPVYNNPVLRTWDIGEYDGAPEGSFKEKQWAAKSSTPVPGGESFDSFAARMEKAFEFANNAPKDDDIVTHSKVTRAFKALHDTDGQWTDKTTKKFLEAKDEPKKENGGWLNKYEQGGMVLEKKGDNYGKQSNYNDAKASTGPGFVGLGYDTTGRHYSPAWGGQFQNGGSLHNKAWVDSVNNANIDKDFVQRYYAKNNPPAPIHLSQTPSGEMSTHYMADADNVVFPTVVNPKTFNPLDVYTQPGSLQYLDKPGPVADRKTAVDYARRTGEYIDFKNEQDAQWYANNGYKKGTGVLNSIDKGKAYNNPKYQMGGSMPGAVGFTYARTAGSAPANGKYTKKTKASAQNGKEMSFYQNGLDFTPKTISKNGKKVIKDDRGQWDHPGEITEIGSNNITMQGVDYPVLGVSDTGHQQMMYPDQHYKFEGKKVTEYPMMQEGGWLNKYDNISATSPLKKQAEEFLARRNANRPTMGQYTPKKGEQERLNAEKSARLEEANKPLNKAASSKYAANAMNNIVEPMIAIEAGIGGGKLIKAGAEAAGKYLTEETALKNAYKLNPYAFKPDPEAYYRTLGKEGIDDAFGSGVIRPKQYHNKYSPELGKRIDVNEPEFPEGSYFNKSGIYSSNKLYNPDYIAEVKGKDELFTYPERVVFNENIRVAPKDIPIEQANFYKKDWLKGYKEVAKPTSTQQVTRGPINWWDEPKYKKQNPNFDPQTYLNNPVGNQFYSKDIPKGMEPRYFEDNKNGGWLNKYK